MISSATWSDMYYQIIADTDWFSIIKFVVLVLPGGTIFNKQILFGGVHFCVPFSGTLKEQFNLCNS